MNIVLLGVQGSGKGTQAEIMAKRYNLASFEMGNEFRTLAEKNSPLGHKIKTIIDNGKLVPTQIVIQVLESFLEKIPINRPVIFDGIPRNQKQQKAFNKLMKAQNRDFLVVNIGIPEEETMKRLTLRSRHDDTPDIIKQRTQIFLENTQPVIQNYRQKNLVIEINGNQKIATVAKEIHQHLDSYFLKHS